MDTRQKQLVGAGIALLILVGLGIWWYQRRPEKVVNEAVSQLANTQSQAFSAVIELENNETTKQVLGEEGKVEVRAQGAYKKQEPMPALKTDLTMTIKTESVSVQLAGETRFIDDKAYLLITKTPTVFPALAGLKEQWIELKRGGQNNGGGTSIQQFQGPLFTSIKRERV